MGCNKSKSQHGGDEACLHNEELTSPWEVGQEPHSLYGENFEFNQNEISNSGFISNNDFSYHPRDTFRANSEQQTAYSYSRANSEQQTGYSYSNTGSFVDAAPPYNLNNGFDRDNYFSSNECNQNFNNFSQERLQGTNTQPQYHNALNQQPFHNVFNHEQSCGALNQERVMGPPLRPISAKSNYSKPRFLRPLVRRSSFNDDYRRLHHQSTHYNSMVRHRSLENIPTGYRNRYSRNHFASDDYLFQNSSFGNEEYPRFFNQRRCSSVGRRRQRGTKRNSWDDDSLNSNSTLSDNSGSFTENPHMLDATPRVKRRPSNIDDRDNEPADSTNGGRKEEKDDMNSSNETKVMLKSVEQLNVDDEPFDILDLLMFPEEWSSCAIDGTGLVDISLSSPEGTSVHKYFSRTSYTKDFKLCINTIARIENPFMHSYYLLKKQEMESRNEHVDELYLYHGTKKEHLSGILEDNLNWRLYSEKHRFGQGVSFSPLATYSSHYSDKTSEKVMLLVKVLACNSTSGSPDMKVPPIIGNVVYDTSIKEDTTVIVKYSDNEFYPLYKITYTKMMRIS